MTLNELAEKYGSDKSGKVHGYTDVYNRLFDKRERVTKVAEIGVQRGGGWRNNHPVPSLKMWQHWFYNSTVYGMDLKQIKHTEPNIVLMVGDQSKRADLERFAQTIGDDVDLIIDDGSHRPEDMILTFQILSKCVRIGGYYVFEDCRAKVQNEYPIDQQIHARLDETDISDWELQWGDSKSAGKKSLAILRRIR